MEDVPDQVDKATRRKKRGCLSACLVIVTAIIFLAIYVGIEFRSKCFACDSPMAALYLSSPVVQDLATIDSIEAVCCADVDMDIYGNSNVIHIRYVDEFVEDEILNIILSHGFTGENRVRDDVSAHFDNPTADSVIVVGARETLQDKSFKITVSHFGNNLTKYEK